MSQFWNPLKSRIVTRGFAKSTRWKQPKQERPWERKKDESQLYDWRQESVALVSAFPNFDQFKPARHSNLKWWHFEEIPFKAHRKCFWWMEIVCSARVYDKKDPRTCGNIPKPGEEKLYLQSTLFADSLITKSSIKGGKRGWFNLYHSWMLLLSKNYLKRFLMILEFSFQIRMCQQALLPFFELSSKIVWKLFHGHSWPHLGTLIYPLRTGIKCLVGASMEPSPA